MNSAYFVGANNYSPLHAPTHEYFFISRCKNQIIQIELFCLICCYLSYFSRSDSFSSASWAFGHWALVGERSRTKPKCRRDKTRHPELRRWVTSFFFPLRLHYIALSEQKKAIPVTEWNRSQPKCWFSLSTIRQIKFCIKTAKRLTWLANYKIYAYVKSTKQRHNDIKR